MHEKTRLSLFQLMAAESTTSVRNSSHCSVGESLLACCLSKPWCSPLAAGDIMCITRSSSNKRHPSWVFYESAD